MMKKVLATVAMMGLALTLVIGGAMAEADVTILDAIEIVSIEESSPALCNVVFYDFLGLEYAAVQVESGSYVAEPDTAPLSSDASFQHWYDEADEWKTAFDFTQPVYGDIVLRPYSAQASNDINGILSAGQETNDASLILITPVVVESAPAYTPESILAIEEPAYTAPAAQETPPAPVMTIDQLFGGNAPAEAPQTQQPATSYNANSILTIDQVIDTPAPASNDNQRAVVEQNAVNDILGAQQTMNALETLEDYDVPMAAPAAAPSVEVVCEYDGELKSGAKVTVRAVIHNLPSDSIVSYQWQNDATGSFEDVTGATGETFTFLVDEYSATGCNWRVNVELSA